MKRFFRSLLSSQGTRTMKSLRRGFQPSLEALEGRALPAVRIYHSSAIFEEYDWETRDFAANVTKPGVMTIVSDSHSDNVQVFWATDEVSVVVNRRNDYSTFGADVWIFSGPRHLTMGVEFLGNGGNDFYFNNTAIPDVNIRGGSGNDTLIGGFGQSVIWGGSNDDSIYLRTRYFGGTGYASAGHGEGGNDHIYGSMRRDYLTGGSGGDWLEGAEDNDYLAGDLGGDVLLGGSEADVLDGGFDGTVDLLLGGAGADAYLVHYADTHNLQLDGTPRSSDIQPEVFVNDGTDRVVYVPHALQATMSMTWSESGIEASSAWNMASILDGRFGEAEISEDFAPPIMLTADDLPPMETADGDLWELTLGDSFVVEDPWHTELNANIALDVLLWESEAEALMPEEVDAAVLADYAPSIGDALLEPTRETEQPLEEVDLVTVTETDDISLFADGDAVPLEAAEALLAPSISSSLATSFWIMLTAPNL